MPPADSWLGRGQPSEAQEEAGCRGATVQTPSSKGVGRGKCEAGLSQEGL